MEQAGVFQALRRGIALLKDREHIPELPEWLTCTSFAQACAQVHCFEQTQFVAALRTAEHNINTRLRARMKTTTKHELYCCGDPPTVEGFEPLPPWAASESAGRMAVATACLALGAAVESTIAEHALDIATPGARPSGATARKLTRLYADAHLVAVWTSAHAIYVSAIQSGVEEPPVPSVFSMQNAASEIDWSDLFTRRWCPRLCPKSAQPLLQILMRSTNPGSRGWDTLLDSSLADCPALRLVVGNAALIALTAMHPYLHPALRPPWWMRMRVAHIAQQLVSNGDSRAAFVTTAPATKEVMRRLLASSTATSPALHAAMTRVEHPVGHLTTPPLAMPARGMEGAMAAFVTAGIAMATTEKASYAACVSSAFSRHEACSGSAENANSQTGISWDFSWLGKGTASVHNKVSLVRVAADLWSTAFRTHFLVFWAHCMVNKLRSTRLDPVQYEAIHSLNACTRLTLELPEDVALAVQRRVLQNPSSGILTMEEAALELGIQGICSTSSNGGAKNAMEALQVISAAGAEATAKLLVYARAAWANEEILIVDLGERTKTLQTNALFRRFGREPTSDASLSDLPVQATTLHACTECRRIANAVCSDGGRSIASFNELGVSSSMICLVCENGSTHIRCAKRSSAALRSAVQFQEDMEVRQIENMPTNSAACVSVLNRNFTTSIAQDELGISARVRRDAKNAIEQRASAIACGESPMLVMPIVGRAIRLWDAWYALCSYCGATVQVKSHNRFGAEICCLRCDAEMLGVTPLDASAPGCIQNGRHCRFCGKACPIADKNKWKVVKSPHDVAGQNAKLPQPLRIVTYCPSHWRSWLSAAHKIMSTRVILSHLAYNAKPVFSSETAKRHAHSDLGFEQMGSPKRKKQRNKKKNDDNNVA